MKDWKACERRIAEFLGGRRIPVTGRQRGDTPDIEHGALSIEVKSRKSLPVWLLGALDQAQAASKDGKVPVVVLHQDRAPYAESLVVLRLKDFVDHSNLSLGNFSDARRKPLDATRRQSDGRRLRGGDSSYE